MYLLSLDIETIQDKEAAERILIPKYGLQTFEEYEVFKKEKTGKIHVFLPLPFHTIVCLAFILIDVPNKQVTYSYVAGDELTIVDKFWSYMDDLFEAHVYPTIVTFNGLRFDLPLLILKALKYCEKLSEKALLGLRCYLDDSDHFEKYRPFYLHTYSKYQLDILQKLGSGNAFSLHALCNDMGIQVKTTATFADVEKLYEQGDYHSIIEYCMEDTVATTLIALRYLFATQALNRTDYSYISGAVAKILQSVRSELGSRRTVRNSNDTGGSAVHSTDNGGQKSTETDQTATG